MNLEVSNVLEEYNAPMKKQEERNRYCYASFLIAKLSFKGRKRDFTFFNDYDSLMQQTHDDLVDKSNNEQNFHFFDKVFHEIRHHQECSFQSAIEFMCHVQQQTCWHWAYEQVPIPFLSWDRKTNTISTLVEKQNFMKIWWKRLQKLVNLIVIERKELAKTDKLFLKFENFNLYDILKATKIRRKFDSAMDFQDFHQAFRLVFNEKEKNTKNSTKKKRHHNPMNWQTWEGFEKNKTPIDLMKVEEGYYRQGKIKKNKTDEARIKMKKENEMELQIKGSLPSNPPSLTSTVISFSNNLQVQKI